MRAPATSAPDPQTATSKPGEARSPAFSYRVFGLDIRANVEIAGFPRSEAEHTDVEITWNEGAWGYAGLDSSAAIYTSHYHPAEGGYRPFALFQLDGRYVLRWEDLCDFEVADDGSQITCRPWRGTSWEKANPFIQGRLLPLALNFKRAVTLHGAAVRVDDGAVALLGASGTGKSTLSATFDSLGHTLISDDVVAVWQRGDEAPAVEWGPCHVRLDTRSLDYLMLRLNGSAVTQPDYDKTRLTLRDSHHGAPGPTPLRTIYLLERAPDGSLSRTEIVELPPVKALPAILQGISNRSILPKSRLAEQLGLIIGMLGKVPVKRLRYASGMDRLPEVCEAVNTGR